MALAINGGGVYGILYVNTLEDLQKKRGNLVFKDGIYGISVGSIIATALAFNIPLEKIRVMCDKKLNYESILPEVRLQTIKELILKGGAFSMDKMKQSVIDAFKEENIDLTDKKIKDAPQKLFIISTNIIANKPTIFTENVPILEAILCSCCLPFIFKPQELYGQLYIDGGLMVPYLQSIVPKHTTILELFLDIDIKKKELDIILLIKKLYCLIRQPHLELGDNTISLRSSS